MRAADEVDGLWEVDEPEPTVPPQRVVHGQIGVDPSGLDHEPQVLPQLVPRVDAARRARAAPARAGAPLGSGRRCTRAAVRRRRRTRPGTGPMRPLPRRPTSRRTRAPTTSVSRAPCRTSSSSRPRVGRGCAGRSCGRRDTRCRWRTWVHVRNRAPATRLCARWCAVGSACEQAGVNARRRVKCARRGRPRLLCRWR